VRDRSQSLTIKLHYSLPGDGERKASQLAGKSGQAAFKMESPANTFPGLFTLLPGGGGLQLRGGGGYGLVGADKVIGIQGSMTPPRCALLVRAGRGDNYLLLSGSPAGRAAGRRARICGF
jgi:hypothetical protein